MNKNTSGLTVAVLVPEFLLTQVFAKHLIIQHHQSFKIADKFG
jgi:hypothetical protein